jgi:Cu+-exporting ATPase
MNPDIVGSQSTDSSASAIDPVCGMTVDPSAARDKGLHSRHQDTDYFFCGKGCELDFDEDPERYLDPSYVPSM